MRRAFWPTLLGVMLILSGIFCLFSPVTSSTVIPYMIGIALTATGIGKLIRRADERRFYGQSSWSFAGAVVSLIFGILLMVSPTLQLSMGTTVVVLIGCWITIMGILRIVHAFQLRKMTAYVDIFGRPVSNDWYMALLPGIAMVAVGILNVLHPSIGLGMIGALVGVLMLLCGSTLLSFGQLSWFW